jgi:hypothetical protein
MGIFQPDRYTTLGRDPDRGSAAGNQTGMGEMMWKNPVAARVLGIAAICIAPTFVIFGWWVLGISLVLGLAATILDPGVLVRGHRSPGRRVRDAIHRRFDRHPWRPGAR